MTPIERVRDALQRTGARHKPVADGELWQCPAHDDNNPSLHVSEGSDGRVLLHCLAGCDRRDVTGKLGLGDKDLYAKTEPNRPNLPATPAKVPTRLTGGNVSHARALRPARNDTLIAEYVYADAQGEPVVKVQRYHAADGSKRFVQRRYVDGGWRAGLDGLVPPLYRLPDVLAAIRAGVPVWVVEGEKDANSLMALGHVATCNAMGAGKWRATYNETLRGGVVVVVADDDGPGRAHAGAVVRALEGVARVVVPVLPAEGCKDVSDHLAAGYDLSALRPWTPDGDVSQETEPEQGVRARSSKGITVQKAEWLWSGRIPTAAMTLIAGRAGVGKSCVLMWLTARITRGELPGRYLGQPRAVLYSASEDSWPHTVLPRLIAADADLSLVYQIDHVEDGRERSLILPNDCDGIVRAIDRTGAVMLALDPLMSTIAGSIDTHRNRELRHALEPLAEIGEVTDCAVVGLAHLNKSSGTDPLSLITGSAAFGEVARAALGCVRDPDGEGSTYVMTQLKNNLGRLDLPSLTYIIESVILPAEDGVTDVGAVRWTGETGRTMSDILAERRESPYVSHAGRVKVWLTGFLEESGGSASARDVYAAAESEGFSSNSVWRAAGKIGIIKEKLGMREGWIWSLEDPTKLPKRPHVQSSDLRRPCETCGELMAVYVEGQRTHPSCTESDRESGTF